MWLMTSYLKIVTGSHVTCWYWINWYLLTIHSCSYRKVALEIAYFVSACIVISGFGLPLVLAHSGVIPILSGVIACIGNLFMFGTVYSYFIFFRSDDEWEFSSFWFFHHQPFICTVLILFTRTLCVKEFLNNIHRLFCRIWVYITPCGPDDRRNSHMAVAWRLQNMWTSSLVFRWALLLSFVSQSLSQGKMSYYLMHVFLLWSRRSL